jgi:hypothetical protein
MVMKSYWNFNMLLTCTLGYFKELKEITFSVAEKTWLGL